MSAKLSAASFEFSVERFEFCAISAPIEAAYLRCAHQDSSAAEVCCLTGQVACSTFGIHRKCSGCMTRGTLQMSTTLSGTCHAARRTQLAWAAYAAFSNVSSTIGARSSAAKPPGSASHSLGVSIAAQTSEIVPKWKCLNGAKQEQAEVGTRP